MSTPSLEDLDYLVRSSGESGVLDSAEVQLLTRTIRFGDKVAADVLVPRVALHTLDDGASVADLVALSAETGRSRFPVIGESIDDVVGIVHVKSALAVLPAERAATPITSVTSPVLAVPEGRELVAVMADLRRSRNHLAIVVDEHGGTAGVVTLEDLLEEIVGEIDDEHDDATELTVVEDEGVTVLDGGLHRDEVIDACGFAMPDGPYETLAGCILDRLQRIPVEGEVLRDRRLAPRGRRDGSQPDRVGAPARALAAAPGAPRAPCRGVDVTARGADQRRGAAHRQRRVRRRRVLARRRQAVAPRRRGRRRLARPRAGRWRRCGDLPLTLSGAQLGITMASLGLGVVAEPARGRAVRGRAASARVCRRGSNTASRSG